MKPQESINHPPGVPKVYSISFKNDVKEISRLEGFMEAIAADTGMGFGLVNSLNLALEEAVTNVVLYAYPTDTTGSVDICADVRGNTLTFTITDGGRQFDPTAAPDADTTLSAEERPIGGLGIFLVKTIMDSVSYKFENGKNILTMTKNI